MKKRPVEYSILEDLINAKKKTIDVRYVDPTKTNLRKLLQLAKMFNKVVSFKAWKYTVKIDKKTRLKDVFEKCRKIEAKRLAPRSPQQLEKAMAAFRNADFDDGPYSGFMSG